MTTHCGDLTDAQWEKLKPLLPPQKAHTGRPAEDHRRIINGILWIQRTGHLGMIYLRAMVHVVMSPVASTAGKTRPSGSGFGNSFNNKPTKSGRLIRDGEFTLAIAPSFALTSTLLGQKGAAA